MGTCASIAMMVTDPIDSSRSGPIGLGWWLFLGWLAYFCAATMVAVASRRSIRAKVPGMLKGLAAKGEEMQAATIAHLVGQVPKGEALALAREKFCGLPIGELRREDLVGHVMGACGATESTERLRLATTPSLAVCGGCVLL